MSNSDLPSADHPAEILVELDRLQEVTLGQVELQRELLEALIEVLQVNVAAIESALQVSDQVTVSRCAHLIKGAAANVGVTSIQAIATELEYQVVAQNLSNAPELLVKLKHQELGINAFISNHLSE